MTEPELLQSSARITAFCGGCHNPPLPSSFPKDAWYKEVHLAYKLFIESGRKDLDAPSKIEVVRWFRTQAPEKLTLPVTAATPSPVTFRRQTIPRPATSDEINYPAISFLGSVRSTDRETPWVAVCDMYMNKSFSLTVSEGDPQLEELSASQHPAHMDLTDLDADGRTDYLISDLGSFLPADHDQGRLIWLRPTQSGNLQQHVLLDGVGRVADARAADFDGDGDLDIIVAEFGWRTTGAIHLLTQAGISEAGVPEFDDSVIDDRHGTIHVPVADLDDDGDLDFVALVSQEYEQIDAFLNRGDGVFERQIIHLAGDPAFGSSGIELVDLDADNDLDVLYTNGDALDTTILKPYDGVRWLENEGDFPFSHRELAELPGAYRAIATDMDRDGDLDIVASAWLPKDDPNVIEATSDGFQDVLIWLEQTADGSFERHGIRRAAKSGYLTVSTHDLDRDGDHDILAGWFGDGPLEDTPWLDIFWNDGGTQKGPPGE